MPLSIAASFLMSVSPYVLFPPVSFHLFASSSLLPSCRAAKVFSSLLPLACFLHPPSSCLFPPASFPLHVSKGAIPLHVFSSLFPPAYFDQPYSAFVYLPASFPMDISSSLFPTAYFLCLFPLHVSSSLLPLHVSFSLPPLACLLQPPSPLLVASSLLPCAWILHPSPHAYFLLPPPPCMFLILLTPGLPPAWTAAMRLTALTTVPGNIAQRGFRGCSVRCSNGDPGNSRQQIHRCYLHFNLIMASIIYIQIHQLQNIINGKF